MTDSTHSPAPAPDASAEFDRQVRTLVALGYPALSGRTPEQFAELVAPLRAEAVARTDRAAYSAYEPAATGRVPFVLVVGRELAPVEGTMPLATLRGG
ncbi:hypothetical protein GTY88_34840, partial [Streptomyces sp. SID5926]|nr:hypothetical protein [Streptomyces sp. SID5926]